MHFHSIGIITTEQERALFGMLRLLLPPEISLPTTLEALHKVTQDFLIRPREIKSEYKPGLTQNDWVTVTTGPAGERSGCQDSPKLLAYCGGAIEEYTKIFGFYDPLIIPDGVTLPHTRVLSAGAMYARVCLRMQCAQKLVTRGVVQNQQIYVAGSSRGLFDAERKELAEKEIVLPEAIEAEMVKQVAKEHGFVEANFLTAPAKINAVRADTEDEGKALAATHPDTSVLVVSNAPFTRRQGLDIFKALLQQTATVPVVIAIGDGCTPKTPLFTMIEELSYWIHSAKEIITWTNEHHPELSTQVSLAIADIMNMGKPGYLFQSDAYQKAFPLMPVVEQPGIPSPFSMWRFLGGQLAEPSTLTLQ